MPWTVIKGSSRLSHIKSASTLTKKLLLKAFFSYITWGLLWKTLPKKHFPKLKLKKTKFLRTKNMELTMLPFFQWLPGNSKREQEPQTSINNCKLLRNLLPACFLGLHFVSVSLQPRHQLMPPGFSGSAFSFSPSVTETHFPHWLPPETLY